jgi:16S rRNA (cytidine1402-2'-O)-methyltransferase
VRAAIEAGHHVEVLPGASAVTTAVALAAVPAPGFLFLGFPPHTRSDAVRTFESVARLPYSLVLFESPHRLERSLTVMLQVLGNRQVVAARELTKIHEEAIRTDLEGLIAQLAAHPAQGEWTLVVAPSEEIPTPPTEQEIAKSLEALRASGATGRDAVKEVSDSLGVARREVYRLWLRANDQSASK